MGEVGFSAMAIVKLGKIAARLNATRREEQRGNGMLVILLVVIFRIFEAIRKVAMAA